MQRAAKGQGEQEVAGSKSVYKGLGRENSSLECYNIMTGTLRECLVNNSCPLFHVDRDLINI